MAKKSKKVSETIVSRCVGVFRYNLQMFDEFSKFEPKDLKITELAPDPQATKDVKDVNGNAIDVHVITLITPQVDGKYLQGIFHVAEKGIITFMISSLMYNPQNN